jgi:uncharacterized delta-60 repeat protein
MMKFLLPLMLIASLCHAQLPTTADPGFLAPSVWSAFNTQVDNIALQPDGKVLIVTANSEPSWVRKLERLNADGSLDSTFPSLEIAGNNDFNTPLIVLPDGDILLGDAFLVNGVLKGMVRLNSDGTVDNGFTFPASLGTPYIMSLALQPDGKILVGGFYGPGIVRLNPDGSLDPTFADTSSYNLAVFTTLLQADGKIVVGGDFYYYNGAGFVAIDVMRLNANGTVDLTFTPPTSDGTITALAQQPDGKFIIGGSFSNVGPMLRRAAARLNNNGTLDNTFVPNFYSNTSVSSILVRPNGNILVGGYPILITMLLPDGGIDGTFMPSQFDGHNGITMGNISSSYSVKRLLQQPDGKIIHCGDYGLTCAAYYARNICRILGTDYYSVNGTTRLDLQNNGCDNSDAGFPFVKYKLVNGTNISYYYGSPSGAHNVFVKNGVSVITPELDNPSWFSISPASLTVDMPSTLNYATQNFCVTPVGTHNDLEVSVVPLHPAVPGLWGDYKIVVRNKGNQAATGSVSFAYDEALSDYYESTPTATATPGQATWNFGAMPPLSELEFKVRLGLNSPSDTPPLHVNNILYFTATAVVASDEVPTNNVAECHQILVYSFDPNDKTCVEGATISPAQAGDYVHYVIRFENTGNWAAQKVTVTDVIDTAKYDIASLTPLDGSHSFITRVTAGNQVEFIFDHINLGFTDADNDGYVAFKIRTKSTLQEGDSFQNSANIVFDYNTPITTNTATTIVQTPLHTVAFESAAISIAPVPAHAALQIQNPGQVKIESIAVYNLLGQMIFDRTYSENNRDIDISALANGTYFLHLQTGEGELVKKFIKM